MPSPPDHDRDPAPVGEPAPVLVLAAGRGLRMGGPKALMSVAGAPWWRLQEARLRRALVTPWWVIAPGDWTALPTGRWVAGRPAEPMFESLRAGLSALLADAQRTGRPPDGLFVLPIDVPAPSPRVWSAMLAALRAPPGPRPIVPAYRGRAGHPVLLPWAWAAQRLADAPAGSRLDELIRESVSTVDVTDPGVVTNLNTPDDLAAWMHSNPRG